CARASTWRSKGSPSRAERDPLGTARPERARGLANERLEDPRRNDAREPAPAEPCDQALAPARRGVAAPEPLEVARRECGCDARRRRTPGGRGAQERADRLPHALLDEPLQHARAEPERPEVADEDAARVRDEVGQHDD